MIELRNVNKSYPRKEGSFSVLKNINLKINAGEIFGIIGKSGAGKSTLLRCVNLLERPSQGSVIVSDKDLTHLSESKLRKARRKIGMIFQSSNLLSSRTVYDNVALPLELIGHKEIAARVNPLLELTGLIEKKNNYPAQLSGGQKQRVAIARALACQPDVLLCDEATSALDIQTTKTILQLLKDINSKLGVTILLITHEMDVIKEISDRVALIEQGEIIEQASTAEFFIRPKTTIAQKLVASCLKHDLPITLQARISQHPIDNSNRLLRILFHGQTAEKPLITELMQHFGIKLNILQANIEFLKTTPLGIMVAEVIADNGKLQQGIEYLTANDVKVEMIGYVRHDVA